MSNATTSTSQTTGTPSGPVDTAPDASVARLWITRAIIVAAVVIPIVLIFAIKGREATGGMAIVLMFVLMLLRIPVAFALAIPGLIGIYALSGSIAFENVMKGVPMGSAAQWALSVIPMFVLMGLMLGYSGVTTQMYLTARNWLSWLPGGLAIGTNLAGTGLAAVSGSTIGTTYALARVGIPEMFKAGYKPRLAIGSVIVAGLPGQLIPPSIFLVIVAGLLENPVGPQLIAGVIPGLSVALMFSIMIIVYSLIFPKWAGRGPGAVKPVITWGERWSSLSKVWPVVALIVLVFGGMFAGFFTATEAGAAGALGAIILLLIFQRKNKPFKHLVNGALETVTSVGVIFFMLAGATIFGSLIAVSGIGRLLADVIAEFNLDRVTFLILIMIIYILLGMFMDPLAILLTTIPIVVPVLEPLGIDPLWFGVFAVFMGEFAILTPPVGMLSFIIHKIVQDPTISLGQSISLGEVFKAVMTFLPMGLVITILWIAFPQIITWLPSAM